jgi:hypothetical protein
MVSNDATDKVAVILRWGPGGQSGGAEALVLHNWHDTLYTSYVVKGVPTDGRWYKRFDGDAKKYSSMFDDACASQTYVDISGGQGSVCLPKMSMVVFTR